MADEDFCKVCENIVGNAHKCVKCKGFVHLICGKAIGEEGYGQEVICFNCSASDESEKKEAKKKSKFILFVIVRMLCSFFI